MLEAKKRDGIDRVAALSAFAGGGDMASSGGRNAKDWRIFVIGDYRCDYRPVDKFRKIVAKKPRGQEGVSLRDKKRRKCKSRQRATGSQHRADVPRQCVFLSKPVDVVKWCACRESFWSCARGLGWDFVGTPHPAKKRVT